MIQKIKFYFTDAYGKLHLVIIF